MWRRAREGMADAGRRSELCPVPSNNGSRFQRSGSPSRSRGTKRRRIVPSRRPRRRASCRDPELEAIKGSVPWRPSKGDRHRRRGNGTSRKGPLSHLVEGLTLDQIAKSYCVHHATVLLCLRAASARVLVEPNPLLKHELNLRPDEFDSLVRLLVSQLDVDISRVLGSRANTEGHG
jgi:hypothetical protein